VETSGEKQAFWPGGLVYEIYFLRISGRFYCNASSRIFYCSLWWFDGSCIFFRITRI